MRCGPPDRSPLDLPRLRAADPHIQSAVSRLRYAAASSRSRPFRSTTDVAKVTAARDPHRKRAPPDAVLRLAREQAMRATRSLCAYRQDTKKPLLAQPTG